MGYHDTTMDGHKGEYNKPAETETYIRRPEARKNFNLLDNVTFDVNTDNPQIGIILQTSDENITIVKDTDKSQIIVNSIDVYKTNEFSKYGHWDFIPTKQRTAMIKAIGLTPSDFIQNDWSGIPLEIRSLIRKVDTGAVNSAPSSTDSQGATTSTHGTPGRSIRELNTKKEKMKPSPDPSEEADPGESDNTVESR